MEKIEIYDGDIKINAISIMCMFKNNEIYLKDFFFKTILEMEILYDVNFEFYIIENNSTDNTRQLLRDFFKLRTTKSKLLLFNMKEDFKNIGNGKNFERIYNLAKIRNKLLDNVVPLPSEWSLYIDSNIFFKKDILVKLFECSPSKNNIGMILPYTQQLFIPDIHKIPNLKKATLLNHYYDTFSFYDTNNKTFWPHCAFDKCKICKRADCMDRTSISEDSDVVDVNSGFGGFALIKTDILNDNRIRWETLSHEVSKDESICEHFLFCYTLKKITNKRIVILQNVNEIYRTF
jgi:hypothetical protein